MSMGWTTDRRAWRAARQRPTCAGKCRNSRCRGKLASVALLSLLLGVFVLAFNPVARAEVGEIRIGIQPGLIHLPWNVMAHEHLIERRAAQAGLGELTVKWFSFAGGAALNDAILSNSVDFAETGPPSLVILWAKTHGNFKGLAGSGASPMVLVTRNPDVRTIKDFTERDRIAVPAVKTSTQAILLAMAAEAAFGPGNHTRLDPLTITRSHPDAVMALSNPSNEIDSHFSTPPYLYRELAMP